MFLQTLAAARMLTPSGPMGQTHWGDTASNSPNPTTHSADAQLKVLVHSSNYKFLCFYISLLLDQLILIALILFIFPLHVIACSYWLPLCYLFSPFLDMKQQELAAVFKKIGDKQTCTIGLYELYRITQLYPKVWQLVSQRSLIFLNYLS